MTSQLEVIHVPGKRCLRNRTSPVARQIRH